MPDGPAIGYSIPNKTKLDVNGVVAFGLRLLFASKQERPVEVVQVMIGYLKEEIVRSPIVDLRSLYYHAVREGGPDLTVH